MVFGLFGSVAHELHFCVCAGYRLLICYGPLPVFFFTASKLQFRHRVEGLRTHRFWLARARLVYSWRFFCYVYFCPTPIWIHFLGWLYVFPRSARFLGVNMAMYTFWSLSPKIPYISLHNIPYTASYSPISWNLLGRVWLCKGHTFEAHWGSMVPNLGSRRAMGPKNQWDKGSHGSWQTANNIVNLFTCTYVWIYQYIICIYKKSIMHRWHKNWSNQSFLHIFATAMVVSSFACDGFLRQQVWGEQLCFVKASCTIGSGFSVFFGYLPFSIFSMPQPSIAQRSGYKSSK